MTHRLALSLTVGLLALGPRLFGQDRLPAPAQAISTERFDFAPGGVIRINHSYGDLYIEGWDQPQVEITVTKTMPCNFESKHPEKAAQDLEQTATKAERRSSTDLEISTTRPARAHFHLPLSRITGGSVALQYQVHVPRNSRLVIHHGVGFVSVSDVSGNIEATCHRGDILLWLPEAGVYSIDARSKLGKVSSDFEGRSFGEYLVGQKFENGHPFPAQRLFLRVGFGGITIKPILPESQAKRPLQEAAR